MSHVRPVTRLVADSLHSLPWNRTSIALGRPYRQQYRFRKFDSHPRRVHSFAAGAQSDAGLLDQKCNVPERQERTFFDPWEKSARSDDTAGYADANGHTTYKPVTAKKNTLVSREDSCLVYGYDDKVALEEEKIQGRTANEIYSVLRVAASEGTVASIFKVQACLNYLVKELGEATPNVRLYAALILAQCRADGSVAEVERLVEEMHREGFELDVGACHDVLKVLSVHPDYLLRAEILYYMRAKWFQLSDAGWHDVVAGLIREGSLEMAMERMEEMGRQGIRTLGWLYDLMIYALAEREELDEVLKLIRQRVAQGEVNISATLWYYLLDVSSQVLHYDLASYIWKSRVKSNHLNPSSGICINVMNLAARNKDIDLAQDVFDFLGRRDTVFEAQHYEVMLEAYVNADMPTNGFYILSAMQQAGVPPTEGTTRRLFSWLKNNPDRLEEMYIELKNIKESGGSIPVAAVNVLIEAAVQRKKLTLAIDLYKAIPETCVSPANLATFNTLLRLYRYHKRKDLALMLASEMVSAGISPDALTYDRMMLVCLSERDYEDGVRYYREMRAKGFEPRYGSALTLVRTLTKWGDGRVYELLEELQGMDLPLLMGVLRDWVQDNFGKGGNTDMKSEIDGAVTKDHVAKQAVLSVK